MGGVHGVLRILQPFLSLNLILITVKSMLVFFPDFFADRSNSTLLTQPSLFPIPKAIPDPLKQTSNDFLAFFSCSYSCWMINDSWLFPFLLVFTWKVELVIFILFFVNWLSLLGFFKRMILSSCAYLLQARSRLRLLPQLLQLSFFFMLLFCLQTFLGLSFGLFKENRFF